MAAAVQVRKDYSSDDLRRLARASEDADQTRRLLALAVILDGGSRGDAARTGGVGLQVIRDWVLRFNECGPEALRTRKAPGKTPILTDAASGDRPGDVVLRTATRAHGPHLGDGRLGPGRADRDPARAPDRLIPRGLASTP